MANTRVKCKVCGEPIAFITQAGMRIPLHESGGCRGRAESYRKKDLDRALPVKCSWCAEQIFWVQHNGGHVFLDSLGSPWPKHPCYDDQLRTGSAGKSSSKNAKDVNARLGAKVPLPPHDTGSRLNEKKTPAPNRPSPLVNEASRRCERCLKDVPAADFGRHGAQCGNTESHTEKKPRWKQPDLRVSDLFGKEVAIALSDLTALPKKHVRFRSGYFKCTLEGIALSEVLAVSEKRGAAISGELTAIAVSGTGERVFFHGVRSKPSAAGKELLLCAKAPHGELPGWMEPFVVLEIVAGQINRCAVRVTDIRLSNQGPVIKVGA